MEIENIREKACHICADYLGGIWTSLKPDDIIIEKVHGGLINYMFKLTLPLDIQPINNEPKQVIMRNFSGIFKMGQFGAMTENIIVVLVANKKLAPKVYGIFDGGRLDEFVESRNVNSKDIHDPNILENIVQNLAKMHCLEAPISKDPYPLIKKFEDLIQNNLLLNKVPDEMQDNPVQKKLFERYLSLKPQQEYDWLKKIRESSNSPIVLCHNDFQLSNILLCNTPDGTSGCIKFVDYELSGYNFRGNDLSRLMNNFCYDVLPEPPHFKINWEKYPTVEKQREIFKIYLKEIQKQKNSSNCNIADEDADKLIEEIKIFHLIGLFIVMVSTVKQPFEIAVKIDISIFGNLMIDTYLKEKNNFLKSFIK